ncbi:MAG: hypothetical protein LQ337_000750 [Flavoplaca oasis]|nr:MAG: hypothetical protein LQ337_000750 [Flavoplaca oasis]
MDWSGTSLSDFPVPSPSSSTQLTFHTQGMVKKLIGKAHLDRPLIISNRKPQRAIDLQTTLDPIKEKSAVASNFAGAVEIAHIIFTCLGDDDDAMTQTVDEVSRVTIVKGKLFVDCSTVHPDTTDHLADVFAKTGAEFVACPVFGAPAMADAGQLICVLAGPEDSIRKVRPYCKGVMGKANIEFSDQPCSKATLLKIIGNTLILNMIESLAEGHTIAEKSGLGNDNLHQFIEVMFPGPYTAYSGRMMSGDYHKRKQPLFVVDLARKDARHAMGIAEVNGMRLEDVEVADKHLGDVRSFMGQKGDIAGIYGAVRRISGLDFES